MSKVNCTNACRSQGRKESCTVCGFEVYTRTTEPIDAAAKEFEARQRWEAEALQMQQDAVRREEEQRTTLREREIANQVRMIMAAEVRHPIAQVHAMKPV